MGNNYFLTKLVCFVTVCHFQPSLTFAGTDRSGVLQGLHSGRLKACWEYLTKFEVIYIDKNTNFLHYGIGNNIQFDKTNFVNLISAS
jgi:hypothetical protein